MDEIEMMMKMAGAARSGAGAGSRAHHVLSGAAMRSRAGCCSSRRAIVDMIHTESMSYDMIYMLAVVIVLLMMVKRDGDSDSDRREEEGDQILFYSICA